MNDFKFTYPNWTQCRMPALDLQRRAMNMVMMLKVGMTF